MSDMRVHRSSAESVLYSCSKPNMIIVPKLLTVETDRSLMYTQNNIDANIYSLGRLFSCVQ